MEMINIEPEAIEVFLRESEVHPTKNLTMILRRFRNEVMVTTRNPRNESFESGISRWIIKRILIEQRVFENFGVCR
jgi:hypothetical protein